MFHALSHHPGHPTDEGGRLAAGANFRDGVRFFRRQRWRIVAAALAGAALAAAVASSLDPLYASTTQVLIEPPRSSPLEQDPLAAASPDAAYIEGQMLILASPVLLGEVVDALSLDADPTFAGTSDDADPPGALRAILDRLLAGGAATDAVPAPDPRAEAVARLQGMISVSQEGDSDVVALTVVASDPALAARIADGLAASYIRHQADFQAEQAERVSTWLNDRVLDLQIQLREAEDAVEDYKARHDLLGDDRQVLEIERVSDLERQLSEAGASLSERQAAADRARALQGTEDGFLAIPQVMESSVVADLRAELSTLDRRRADIVARYGPDSALLGQVDASRAEVEGRMADEVGYIVSMIDDDARVAEARAESIRAALDDARAQSQAEGQESVELRELERVASARRTLYESFLSRAELAQAGTSFIMGGVRLISPASLSDQPVFPPRKVPVVLGLILGAGLGILWGLAREAMQPGFVTKEQIERTLHLPVLSSLPDMSRGRGPRARRGRRPMDSLLDNPSSDFGEAVRTLRHALLSDVRTDGAAVVQITSAVPGEGKTTLAMSLAASAAGAGHRVLLIDADLRRAELTRCFGRLDEPGLADIITDAPSQDQSIEIDERTGVYVLPAGSSTMNPPDLLASARMTNFLRWARRTFDLVILDSPPAGTMADAPILARLADSVGFVVRWSHTPRELVSDALGRIGPSNVTGIVNNLVNERGVSGYAESYGSYPPRAPGEDRRPRGAGLA